MTDFPSPDFLAPPTRRQLLTMIGKVGGTAALYQAMTVLGHAAESQFNGPPKLSGARPGASVLVLGSGLAGMLAAYELTKAGYKVQILEFQGRTGGRNYSVRGGDTIAELGSTQTVGFAPGNYLNPGPWRIPYHHRTRTPMAASRSAIATSMSTTRGTSPNCWPSRSTPVRSIRR